ncbi:hypothetical protein Zmor_026143 [Zophobas morio]|uniref:Fringe-like glycosyltransferase domain-containing protein n=1 Tax=Zophobas morio TaxID=2755281 RepID=A0AA38M5Q9_9CUCU|nr:hypothetical protein Zmor_026143 [Zophobas morio]
MYARHRRVLQTVSLAALLAYSALLAYQTLSRGLVDEEDVLTEKVARRRAPFDRSLHEDPSVAVTSEASSATATLRPPTTVLHDVFISVKTTKSYHRQRLPIILKTWFQLAKAQTWFFTDTDDPEFQLKTNGHMINTNCSSSHNRKALCCKMSVEFDTFIETDKKWFCHFDDDNYVNVPRLVRFLGDYNPREDWYLGKPSIQAPLEIINKEKKHTLAVAVSNCNCITPREDENEITAVQAMETVLVKRFPKEESFTGPPGSTTTTEKPSRDCS